MKAFDRMLLQVIEAQPYGELANKAKDLRGSIAVVSEVAAMGQGGLQINEPGTSRSLKNLPSSWSDLTLASLIHVGMKRLTPDEDSGLGIEAEYQEAVRLRRSGGTTP